MSAGYLAYVPSGGLPQAAAADLYGSLMNRFTGLFEASPSLVGIEMDALCWLCEMVGFGHESGGLFTSGGSMASLVGLVSARHRHLGDADPRRSVVYRTAQAHHSVDKVVRILGMGITDVPIDDGYRMDPEALDRKLSADIAAGRIPVAVVASAGTTATGVVDDLDALATVCAKHDVWLHVDAAYGGFFVLTEIGRSAMAGMERADSVTLDPHKSLFLPHGTGCLLVRDLQTLEDAHRMTSDYLPPSDFEEEPLAWNFADLGPELSRPCRGLRVWLPLVLHGFAAFRQELDEKITLARVAADAIRALPGVRILVEPTLSLFAFRLEHGTSMDDTLNRAWLEAINRRRRVRVSGTWVVEPQSQERVYALRVCILSHRTHGDRIEALLEDVVDALSEITTPQRAATG